jgi:hypothetical protein
VVWGFKTSPKFLSFDKAEPNSQFCGKYICNNLTTYRVHSFANWVEPLTRGLLPSDPHSLCPQLNLLNPCWTKFLCTPLVNNLPAMVLQPVTSPVGRMGPKNLHLVGPLTKHLDGKQFASGTDKMQAVISGYWHLTTIPSTTLAEQASVQWCDKCLNINDDCMQIWRVPTTTHVLCIDLGKNKVLDITMPATLFFFLNFLYESKSSMFFSQWLWNIQVHMTHFPFSM